MKRHLPLCLLCLILLGCASSQDVGDVRRDITTVYREFRTYRDSTDTRLAKLEKDMSALSQTVKSVEDLSRKQFLDLSMSLESKDEKIRTMLGKLEELESQLRTYWGETKGALKELKGGGETPTPQRRGTAVPQGNYEELYKQAFDAFQRGLYQDSVRTFSEFVRAYPDTPLIPNARYWMGEGYMNMKDKEKAIISFQEVIDKYPNSEKAPRALLRQAEAFGELGDKKSSTTLLKRVIELYPKSDEARVAERLLRGLGVQ